MNKKKIIISAAAAVVVLAGGAYISYNAVTTIAISKKNFPDKIFRNYVAENFDKDHNKFLSDKEISQATRILLYDCDLEDLTGIEHFKNLEYLDCYNTKLTSLDISENTALTFLQCSYDKLGSLDVSNNTALESLECWGCQLTSLDVSKNTALKDLNCCNNQLTSLDISNNEKLNNLSCDEDVEVTK